MSKQWASDVPVSMPVPPQDTIVRRYEGFGVGWYGGVVHEISNAELEDLRRPDFAPPLDALGEGSEDGK